VNRLEGEDRGVKKIGGRELIHSQSREMINAYSIMKKERSSGKVINVNQIQKHVSEATSASLSPETHSERV
jgi:hypothetical protein